MKSAPKGPIEVLLTDGDTRAALAVARSLARHGVSFLVLATDPQSLTLHSRSVTHALLAPSPSLEPEAFLEFALEVIRRYKIQLAIPITDPSVLAFDRHRQSLEEHTTLAMASSQALRCVLDKRLTLELARRLGVPCPRQFELTSPKQIPEMIEALGFPIVLKRPGDPADPNVPTFNFRVLYAHSEVELRAYVNQHCRAGSYPLFQECVVGEIHNFCCFAVQGELVAIHEYHSIRRLEGSGVLRKVVEPIQELVNHTRDLLAAMKWDGIAHVAFSVSSDHKKQWHMETNGRFWASTEGSVYAGWDFPYWVYNYFLHGKRPEPGQIKIGSLTCWHFGDLLALLHYLSGGEAPTTGASPGKSLAILQYLSGFHPAIHSDVFRWNDPMPALMEYWQLSKRLGRLIKKTRR